MAIAAQDSANATQLTAVQMMEIGGMRAEWHVVLSACVTIATMVLTIMKLRKKIGKLPPGPRALPLIGNIHQIGDFSRRNLMQMAEKYGPIMYMRIGSKPLLVVSTAEAAHEFLKTQDKEWADRPTTTADKIFTNDHRNIVCAPYAAHWRHLRKICTMDLFTPKRLMSFRTPRTEEINQMMTSIHEDVAAGKEVKLHVKLGHLTTNNITRMLLGKRFFTVDEKGQMEAHRFKELVFELFRASSTPMIGDFIPWLKWVSIASGYVKYLKRVKADLDAFLQEFLEIKKAASDQATAERAKDFVDLLLEQKTVSGDGPLEDATIRSVIQDMLLAGTDTVSNAMEWTIAELMRHPECMRKLQQELDTVVGKSRIVSETDLPNLPYLQAVVKEVMRFYPPAPLSLPHQSIVPTTVCGYDLPAGTQLCINLYAIQRDPKYWPNPVQFNPDRFLNCDVDVGGTHFQLIPFGAGRRQCPGMPLGNLLLQISVARLVQAFEYSLPRGKDPTSMDNEEKYGVTLPRKNRLAVVATPRLSVRPE